MKWNFLLLLTLTLSFGLKAEAAIISLDISDPSVTVGETLDVDVVLDGEGIGQGLLAFGFDLLPTSGLLSFVGGTVAAPFADLSDPFNPANVSGAAFPAVLENDVLLATLTFSANAAGSELISISGMFDGLFQGLYYELSGFDIVAEADVVIEAVGTVRVAEPSCLALMLAGLVALVWARRSLQPGTPCLSFGSSAAKELIHESTGSPGEGGGRLCRAAPVRRHRVAGRRFR